MKTFAVLFFSSAIFGVAIAAIYYVWSHGELAGTLLLTCMALGLTFALTYALVAEREADLHGDREDDDNLAAAGERLGVFTTRTPWPPIVAFCVLLILVGALWVPFLLAAGLLGLLISLWRLGAESSRVTNGRERPAP